MNRSFLLLVWWIAFTAGSITTLCVIRKMHAPRVLHGYGPPDATVACRPGDSYVDDFHPGELVWYCEEQWKQGKDELKEAQGK